MTMVMHAIICRHSLPFHMKAASVCLWAGFDVWRVKHERASTKWFVLVTPRQLLLLLAVWICWALLQRMPHAADTTGRLIAIWQEIRKFENLQKHEMLIHNWTSKTYVPLDILNMCGFYFGLPGNDCTKDENNSRRSRPPSAADFLCCFDLEYSQFLEVQNKIYTYWVYLMEHIFFEVQLCIKISMFSECCACLMFLPDCQ